MAICYLCGKEITEEISKDHVFPKQFIKRTQPKAKGFDYAGTLPTHPECNNRFGSEKMCKKAMLLLSVIHNPEAHIIRQNRYNQDITIMAINSDYLREFNDADLNFFQMYNAKQNSIEDFRKPEYFADKRKANLHKQTTNIAITVLVKSAAAVLVAKFGVSPKSSWRILAIPYIGKLDRLDFDTILGETKPFEIGIKLWVSKFENADYFAVYKSQDILLWLVFGFSTNNGNIHGVAERFPEADHLLFDGATLNELVKYDWSLNKLHL